ncbi:helix-turn-helix transcriptional regulator, partial [Bacillus cereus group sp. BfR-BA-01393]
MEMLKITLRAARVNAGYKLVEAAKEFGVNKDTLSKYEKDSSNIPRR